jgi:glucose uptake protein
MYLPDSYPVTLCFMIGSMLCWGSWASTMKLCPGYRFQLFYWDYVLGLVGGALLLGFSLGSIGNAGTSFLPDILHATGTSVACALAGGVIFNAANLLLVAAIDIAGMAVAFPVGIGLALVVGALSSYLLAPQGQPLLLFGGLALIIIAIVCDSLAYREREGTQKKREFRGLVISLLAGILMGTFYPLVSRAMEVPKGTGPYATAVFFALGVALCALPLNYIFMRFPIDGAVPVSFAGFRVAPARWHFAGILGGAIWSIGGVLNFAASSVHFVGPAVSYSIGQGATMVSAVWGVFIWREFRNPSPRMTALLIAMFLCFLAGLSCVAVSPIL